jgi:CubicO group peptidase (beta-lactamase class C family)
MPDLPLTRQLLEEGLGTQRWTGYTLTALHRGQRVSMAGGKVTHSNASVCWYSAGKPVISVGVLKLLEQKPDLWDLPLEKTFPELKGSHIGHLKLFAILTHQTGLRFAQLDLLASEGAILRILAQTNPADCQLQPGQPAYDPRGGWWLLGQWIERHTGRPWQNYLHETVLEPAGSGGMFFTQKTRSAEIPMEEWRANHWEQASSMPEQGNLCGSSTELACFYQTLMAGGASPKTGQRILHPASMERFLHRWRKGLKDLTFLHPVDFGLGVILDSNQYGASTVPYGFGTSSSASTFGHGGSRSSIGFADPEADLVVALCLIGQVSEPRHQARMRELLDLLRSELA